MSARESLGAFLVLRQLDSDLLGPVWRLGRRGGEDRIEGLALARAFTGIGGQGRSLREVIDHPFVARTDSVFEHSGRTVVAWDYTSGHSLRSILTRCGDRRQPLAAELAVHIVERLAQGVAAAAERRVEGERLHHGFLRPELLWVTHDGEVKVLGFEVGRALASRLHAAEAFAPYLAPEVRAGGVVDATADVFALAAVLFALLTGADPPAQGAAAAVARAKSAEDHASLPAALAQLLAASLGPAEGRPTSVAALQATLREIETASGRRVGPFELAYALHGLLAEDMAVESREVERGGLPEDTVARPVAAAVVTPTTPVGTSTRSARQDVEVEPVAPPSRSWLPAAAVLAVGVGLGIAWLATRGDDAPAAAAAPQPSLAAAPAGPSTAEIEAQIRALVAQRTQNLAAGLQEKQAEEIAALEEKLRTAQAQEADRAALAAATPAPPASVTSAVASAPVPEGSASPPVVVEREPTAVAQPAVATPTVTAPSVPAQVVTPPPAMPVTAPPVATAAAPPPAAKAPAAAATVDSATSDIASPGAGVVGPKMARFAKPEYPLLARRTKVQGTVVLSVLVDEKGRPVQVRFLKKIDQDVGLNEAAEKAARASTWEPATRNGVPVKMWFTLPVPFALE